MQTYDLAVSIVRDLLSDQLVGPFLGLVTRGGGDSGNDERHFEYCLVWFGLRVVGSVCM